MIIHYMAVKARHVETLIKRFKKETLQAIRETGARRSSSARRKRQKWTRLDGKPPGTLGKELKTVRKTGSVSLGARGPDRPLEWTSLMICSSGSEDNEVVIK